MLCRRVAVDRSLMLALLVVAAIISTSKYSIKLDLRFSDVRFVRIWPARGAGLA